MKKLDVNDYGFAYLTLILLLHYNAEVAVWPFTTINSYNNAVLC